LDLSCSSNRSWFFFQQETVRFASSNYDASFGAGGVTALYFLLRSSVWRKSRLETIVAMKVRDPVLVAAAARSIGLRNNMQLILRYSTIGPETNTIQHKLNTIQPKLNTIQPKLNWQ